MKLVNNILTATIVAANAEALVLGAKAGIDTQCMLEVLRSTAASNKHLTSTYALQALAGNVKPGFAVKLAEKDVGLALKMAEDNGVPIHLADSTLALLREARESGHADDDYTSLLYLLEKKVGVTVREDPSNA
jgi:3-hydroxyisobutyrate dehydrogenase-like beta-hydroxyacid dehydrogenase